MYDSRKAIEGVLMTEIIKYEDDFHGWAMSTAALLREKRYDQVDYNHIIEEIECMGASERRELINRLKQLISHLLKWEYQSALRSKSWKESIEDPREQIYLLLLDNPGLKSQIRGILDTSYSLAQKKAHKETGLSLKCFPPQCPYTMEELVDEEYLPE